MSETNRWATAGRTRIQICVVALICTLFPVRGECHHQDREDANLGQGTAQGIPADLNTAREVISEKKLYKIGYSTRDNVIPFDKLHDWLLSVLDANGNPVQEVHVQVESAMPNHPHGTISHPSVRYIGKGLHLVEGVLFHMKGWWVTTITLKKGDGMDRAQLNVVVQ